MGENAGDLEAGASKVTHMHICNLFNWINLENDSLIVHFQGFAPKSTVLGKHVE